MQPVDEGLDYSSQGMMDEDLAYGISNERMAELHADFRREHIWRTFLTRIEADQQGVLNKSHLSKLGVTPTNSIIAKTPIECKSQFIGISQNSMKSPMWSVPFVVKDNFCLDYYKFQLKTTCASISLNNFCAPYSAAVVSSLLDAGALVVGKSNMDEFAMGCGSIDNAVSGPVVNPWSFKSATGFHENNDVAPNLIAGGSSGGSAAAVAAGLCLAALASDTGGSARLPAAYCGVVGLKPSYGLLSRHGLIPLVNALDVPALITPSVSDVAYILSTWLSPDSQKARAGDSTCQPISSAYLDRMHYELLDLASSDPSKSHKPIRVGIPVEYHVPGLEKDIASLWDRVAGWLVDRLSCSVQLVRLPHTPIATTVYSVLCATEVASNMARYDGLKYGFSVTNASDNLNSAELSVENSLDAQFAATRSIGFGSVVRSRIFAGNFFLLRSQQHRHLAAARRLWRLIKQDFDEVFKNVDILLTPVSPSLPLSIEEFSRLDNRTRTTLDDVCTVAVNLAGLPALSIPLGISYTRGLPISLQLIGPYLSEVNLLTIGKILEQFANFQPLVNMKTILDSVEQ